MTSKQNLELCERFLLVFTFFTFTQSWTVPLNPIRKIKGAWWGMEVTLTTDFQMEGSCVLDIIGVPYVLRLKGKYEGPSVGFARTTNHIRKDSVNDMPWNHSTHSIAHWNIHYVLIWLQSVKMWHHMFVKIEPKPLFKIGLTME